MKILLIYPNPGIKSKPKKFHPLVWSFSRLIATKFSKFELSLPMYDYLMPPFGLVVAAADIPPRVDIELIDERVEDIDYNRSADLVGISVMTSAANHSYKIAQAFERKGIPVVLGGVHPSLLPNEASQYASSVVIGEVEGLWEKIIDDFKNKRLKKCYKNQELPSLKNLSIPRFDLLKKGYYITMNLIETCRGCPFQCSFCASNKIFGNKFRFRPVEDIINEVKERNLENKHIVFMSDNIFGNKPSATSLFKSLIPLNVSWQGSSTIAIAKYPEILKLASKSGCLSLLIGFESLTISNLSTINKSQKQNPNDYPLLIRNIHKANIGITGNFIVGLDDDQETIFDDIVRFVYKNNIECPQVSVLLPYPGTKIHETFEQEERIIDYNWEHYSNVSGNVVYTPKTMSISELQNGYWRTWREMYTTWSIIKRLISTRNFLSFYIPYNLIYKTSTPVL